MTFQQNIVLAILLFPVTSGAQHTTQHTNMFWGGYYNTIRLPNKWSITSDVQLRTKDWTNKWSQLLIRSGLAYSFNNYFSLTSGLAFFKNAQYADKELLLKNEWRTWQELFYQVAIHKINLVQRLRTEQRFLQEVSNNKKLNSYQYIFRLRYKFEWQFPLDEKNTRLLIGNEIMVNPGYVNSKSFSDQNRTSFAVNFKANSITNLQCQYIKIFQWRSSTSVLEDQNVFRVNIFQQFNFKKSKKTKQA